MKATVRHPSSIRQRTESDIENSSRGFGTSIGSTGVVSFRSLRPDDKIVETSLSKTTVRDNDTQADKSRTAVQDTPSVQRESYDVLEPDDRLRNILSLLIRKESLTILERVVSTNDPKAQQERLGPILLSSQDSLYSFARLVIEGGLTVSEGLLQTTALTERILRVITENQQQ